MIPVWSVLSSAGRFFACPPGWVRYKQTCYLFVSSARSWTSAVVVKTLYWKTHCNVRRFLRCCSFKSYWRLCVTLQANCASLGASLASVHDIFDYYFLQELTRRSGSLTSWIGGFYFQVLWQSYTFNMKIKTSSNQSIYIRHDSPSWLGHWNVTIHECVLCVLCPGLEVGGPEPLQLQLLELCEFCQPLPMHLP